MNFTAGDTEALLRLLSWRRDVRHFKTDPIAEATVEKLLASVELAPSVGNSRPWRFVRVESTDVREQIIANHTAANAAAAAHYDTDRAAHYRRLKLAGLVEAPLHLAVFTETEPEAGAGLGRQTMPETLMYSTVLAIHTMWLVARTMNVGLGWVSILDPDKVSSLLDIPPTWHFTAYLCLGYPQSVSQMPELHENDWQTNRATSVRKS